MMTVPIVRAAVRPLGSFLLTPLALILAACRPAADAPDSTAATRPAPAKNEPAADAPATKARLLVFRNVPSWNRAADFEDALDELNVPYETKTSADMSTTPLASYAVIVIPGAQLRTDFYQEYNKNAGRFNNWVAGGGTLLLELNGAEDANLSLPSNVKMISHGAIENEILLPKHPIVLSQGGKAIRANFASHGFLRNVPNTALVLASEGTNGQADEGRPTFVEYVSGKGRVIAACQCFHDQDGSGRGALMKPFLTYGLQQQWYHAE